MWKKALATSEFWMALIGGVLKVLIDQHLVSPEVEPFVLGVAAYVLGRLISKGAKAVPGVPPAVMLGILTALALAGILGCASVAKAEPVSLLDTDRRSVSLSAGASWYSADPTPAVAREVTLGPNVAWVADHLALAAHAHVGVSSRVVRFGPEVRWRFDLGAENVAVGLGYEWAAGKHENLPEYRHEWTASAVYARPVWGPVSAGAACRYGLDNRLLSTRIALAVPVTVGKDH